MNDRLEWLASRYGGHNWPAEESVYSQLIRDEISRQIALLERRINPRRNASSAPNVFLGPSVQPKSSHDDDRLAETDIREKRAMGVYDAMRAGMHHDMQTAKRIEAEKRLEKQLEYLAKLERRQEELTRYVEKRDPESGPSSSDSKKRPA